MTAPSDLIRRDAAMDALARVGILPDDAAMDAIRALPADRVAEAAGRFCAGLRSYVPVRARTVYSTEPPHGSYQSWVCDSCGASHEHRFKVIHAPDCAWETYRAAVAARKETPT